MLSDMLSEELLDKVSEWLNAAEYNFASRCIWRKAVPIPFGIYKDHKKEKDKNLRGFFGLRFVVPSNRQTGCFSKLGYRGIQAIYEKYGIEYSPRTIVNSYHLKSELEEMSLQRHFSTIVSIDIVKMYPSIKYQVIEQAVLWFG